LVPVRIDLVGRSESAIGAERIGIYNEPARAEEPEQPRQERQERDELLAL
jgi:hypothetical protein